MHRGAAGRPGIGVRPIGALRREPGRTPLLLIATLAGLWTLGGCATRPPRTPPEPSPARAGSADVSAPIAFPGSPGEGLAMSARALLGAPYRYGGAAPAGFDCSGLVQYAARSVGITLPRTADAQLRAGAPVSRAGLRSGDLVFMRLAGKELHVGIALDAEHFVHAPSARGRVRVDSLAVEPYARGFFAARRVL